jgi:hypothetical protein
MLQKREWAKINTSNSLNHGAGVMVRTNIPISLCSSHASQAHPTLALDSGCQAAGDVIKKAEAITHRTLGLELLPTFQPTSEVDRDGMARWGKS